MNAIFASLALLADGWADDVRLEIEDGRIAAVRTGMPAEESDLRAGVVIPGLANAHSHAFQRALAGHTERRGPAGKDNFWSWRDRMYRLAGSIDAERLRAIARQAYTEMLESGYTTVVEFHYLHREAGAEQGGDTMLQAIIAAANDSGIRLTYVPILYERAGFEEPQLDEYQQRFASTLKEFSAHYERARELAADRIAVGIGAHSLRAVFPESLAEIERIGQRDGVPIHIHIAEQQREVDQCLDVNGLRPVRWLLQNHALNEQWCLVHATHMDDEEIEALAQTGAVVCLCPSTEANLGDGLFPLQRWLQRDGRIAIGSDSHVSINPFEELRWLEYGQRLKAQQRNIAAIQQEHTGRNLFELAADGGARASGQGDGSLHRGALADLVVLDDDSPMLTGHPRESLLDALVFSGFTLPVDRVMVHGKWQLVDGRHRSAAEAREQFTHAVRSLADGDRK